MRNLHMFSNSLFFFIGPWQAASERIAFSMQRPRRAPQSPQGRPSRTPRGAHGNPPYGPYDANPEPALFFFVCCCCPPTRTCSVGDKARSAEQKAQRSSCLAPRPPSPIKPCGVRKKRGAVTSPPPTPHPLYFFPNALSDWRFRKH